MKFTVLVYRDGAAWVAQALEYDIAAQGPSEQDCKERFMRTVSSMILKDLGKDIALLSNIETAPEDFFYRALNFQHAGPEIPVYPFRKIKVQFLREQSS